MKKGDLIETAMWIDGTETKEQRALHEKTIIESIEEVCQYKGWMHGPVRFIEKHPMDDRVPEVPKHIKGPRVRLLVAECEVTAQTILTPKGSFIANLDKKDLERLRYITRRTCKLNHGEELTDHECDQIIDQVGVEAALEVLRKSVDGDTIH